MVLEADLGDRMTLAIDPNWEHRALWAHPLGTTLRLTFVDFSQGISEAVTPNYINTEVVGRSESFKTWVNNPNKAISFFLKFRVQGLAGEGAQAIEQEVVNPARWIEALKYPVYSPQQRRSYAPPPVIVKIGQFLTARCVLTAGDPQWQFDPVDPETLLPYGCEIQVTFEVVRNFNPDLSYFPSGSSGGPVSGIWT